jgi:hypothetical protein
MKRKLAVLRDDSNGPICPFGLPIPFGCKNAGNLVNKMALISEVSKSEQEDIKTFNKRVLAWEANEEQCVYAVEIVKDKAECNLGESDEESIPMKGLQSSPFYSRVYNNIAYDGLYSYPMGYYADGNISRNLYYGLYSLQGSSDEKSIEKFSNMIEYINDNINNLPDDIKNILYDFAKNYANNQELLKTASIAPKAKNILRIWKDKK